MELHETLRGWPIVAQHCEAFGVPCTSPALLAPSRLRRAKLVVYAAKSGFAGDAFRDTLAKLAAQNISAADIPCTGSTIEAHSPICTLLIDGLEPASIRQTLLTAAGQIREALQ